jgi:hypothetical protein
MRVLSGGPGDLSLRLPSITTPTGYVRWSIGPWDPLVYIYSAHIYLSIIHRPHHLMGSAMPWVFLFDWYYIYYYSGYYFILNLIELLGLKWLSVFSVGSHIWVWILFYYYIILFSQLIWDLDMSEGFFSFGP